MDSSDHSGAYFFSLIYPNRPDFWQEGFFQWLICNFRLRFVIFLILMTKDRQTLHFNDKSQTKMRNLLMLISVCLSEFRVLWIVTVHSTIPQFHKFRFFDITISSLLTHGCNLVSKTNFAIAIFLQWFLKVSKVSEEPHNNFSICQLVVFLVSLILIHANIDCNICNYNFFF